MARAGSAPVPLIYEPQRPPCHNRKAQRAVVGMRCVGGAPWWGKAEWGKAYHPSLLDSRQQSVTQFLPVPIGHNIAQDANTIAGIRANLCSTIQVILIIIVKWEVCTIWNL